MDNRIIIQRSLDYIEDNLQTDITAAELAAQAGFSLFHYYRLFQQAMGLPVMQYILRRRLLHGVYAMKQGSGKTDARSGLVLIPMPDFTRLFAGSLVPPPLHFWNPPGQNAPIGSTSPRRNT